MVAQVTRPGPVLFPVGGGTARSRVGGRARHGRVEFSELAVATGDRLVTDLTREVSDWCRGRGDGLLHLLAPHATAGLALIETGSGSEQDLAEVAGRMFPKDGRWVHRHGSPGHGGDHVLPAFVSPSLVLAVRGGRVRLGTWQSLVLVDPNPDNPDRRVQLTFLAG
jgi:secondary thiamine-phosphate synthase enzyme